MTNGGLLTSGTVDAHYDVRVNEIQDAIVAESARWGDNRKDRGETSQTYTRDNHWLAELNRLRNVYFPARSGNLINQLRGRGAYPSVDAPAYNIGGAYQHGGTITSGAVLTMDNPNASGTIYYTLDGTDPSEKPAGGTITELVAENAAKRVQVPASDIGAGWRTQSGFDDSGWTAGAGGVGFDANTAYQSLIDVDLLAQMFNVNPSCYVRIPFTVDAGGLASLARLTLHVRYDDGFIVYLNGNAAPIAAKNAPGSPAWNSAASSGHNDSLAVNFERIDVTAALGNVQPGNNFLAIQAMNRAAGNNDFLFSMKLTGSTAPSSAPISASAINYSTDSPAGLTDTTWVRARVLDTGGWSALNDATYQIDTADYSALRITEVMYNPAAPDPAGHWGNDDFEFIEIKNTGAKTLDLTGVSLDTGVHFTFNDSKVHTPHLLGPGEYIVVAGDALAFRARHGDGVYLAGRYWGRLDNGGERVRLAGPSGATIVEFTYNDAWFQITDGEGFSLSAQDEAAPALAWDAKSAWRPGSAIGGTPGAVDAPTAPAPGSIVINEILAHSDASDPDWIELYNTTGAAINIGGWLLSDNNGNLAKYEIPAGAAIAAGGHLVFYENTSFGAGNPGTPFALSKNGETVYLSSASGGVLTGYSEDEDFGASETGVSFGRYFKAGTGTYNFVSMTAITPGAANAAPAVGPIVISEIMYNPGVLPSADPDAEYIELHNISASPVALQDAATGATWRLTDGVSYSFPASVTIPAGGRLIVTLDVSAFKAAYLGVAVNILRWDSGRLNNAGERVQLGKPGDVNALGQRQYIRVDRVNYAPAAPWPVSPDGTGDALHRKVPGGYGNDAANWQAGAPTPGN